MFYFMLLMPVIFLPVLFVSKLITQRQVLTLWISFVAAALTESIIDNSLISVAILVIIYLLLTVKSVFLSFSSCKRIMIVLEVNKESGMLVLWNLSGLCQCRFDNCELINSGDVLLVNNYENLINVFDNHNKL